MLGRSRIEEREEGGKMKCLFRGFPKNDDRAELYAYWASPYALWCTWVLSREVYEPKLKWIETKNQSFLNTKQNIVVTTSEKLLGKNVHMNFDLELEVEMKVLKMSSKLVNTTQVHFMALVYIWPRNEWVSKSNSRLPAIIIWMTVAKKYSCISH